MNIRPLLRQRMKGPEVIELQKMLNKILKLKPALLPEGTFGRKTFLAVKDFQRKAMLKKDGVVGNKTWSALEAPLNPTVSSLHNSQQGRLVEIAATYLGAHETGNNRMGNDPRMKEIFEADDLSRGGRTDGTKWCAAFVSLCVQKLLKEKSCYRNIIPPREAAVNHFLRHWAKDQKCHVFKFNSKIFTPQKGDIVIYTFSHIGIVESVSGKILTTIEGNTNAKGSRDGGAVLRKRRGAGVTRAFVRLPLMNSSFSKILDTTSKTINF